MPHSTASALDLSASAVLLTAQICDIESISGNETGLADAIEEALSASDHLQLFRDGDAIVARTNLGRGRRIVIAGHIDTVPVNHNLPTHFGDADATSASSGAGSDAEPGSTTEDDPWTSADSWVETGEYLWGRGTVDMKGGVAVQLRLAAELSTPAYDITWIWYDHEEVDSSLNGLGRLARSRPDLLAGDFAILCEPTGAIIEGGCNGTLRVDVKTTGTRAHAARAWVGHNAIHDLAPILTRLAEYRPREVEVDGLVYREGLNAVTISGGVATNVIPDEAIVHVNYRFAPNRSGDEAVAHLREIFEGYEVVVVDLAEGARPGLDDPLAQEFVAAVGGEARPKYGWTDVARFSALGIPAVNFGPGDPSLAHADDERVLVSEITACENALRGWLNG
jgi:succinyl-diaminopimelate desuccinylase